MTSKGTPSLIPFENFNAEQDAKDLKKAITGLGTDDKTLVEILCSRTLEQRLEIARVFELKFEKSMVKDIEDDTSGNYRKLLVALLTPTIEFYCKELHEAFYDGQMDETVFIDILLTVSNSEIIEIKDKYVKMYNKSLESQIKGDFRYILIALLAATRDETSEVDIESAKVAAQALKDYNAQTYLQDVSMFSFIFAKRNHQQVREILNQYEKLTSKTLEDKIDEETVDAVRDGLISIVRGVNNQKEFIARRFYLSMKGIGTNDARLIRFVRTRCEIDLVDVQQEFEKLYEKPLVSFIQDDTSGNYRKCLLKLLGNK